MNSTHSGSRRFWQFRLWQLFVLAGVISVLLAAMAPRLYRMRQEWEEDRQGWAQGEAHRALWKAILEDQGPDRVREALAAGANVNAIVDKDTPLHAAVKRGQTETAKVLLEHGAILGPVHQPAILAAIDCDQPANKKVEMIRLLLSHGADVTYDIQGVNLMDVAARHDDGEVGDLLRAEGLSYGPREMAAFNRIDELKRAIRESPNILHEQFKPVGSSPIIGESHVSTLLGIAVKKNFLDMAKMLLEAGTPVDIREPDGRTPLHIAATVSGDPEAIRLLIKHGADVNAVDDKQLTPLAALHRDNWRNREAAKAALIEAGGK
jgi:ankyrin repeat protein